MEAVAFFFGLLALVFLALGPAGLVLSILVMTRVNRLERRIQQLQDSLAAARRAGTLHRVHAEPAVVEVRAPRPPMTPEDESPAPTKPELQGAEPQGPEAQGAEPQGPEPRGAEPRGADERAPERRVRPAREPVPPRPTRPPRPPRPRPAPRPPKRPRRRISIETIGLWAVSALGGFILLVAGFLFFKYAIDKGWLGAEVRFAGGLGFGLLCWVAAEALWGRRYRLPAAGLGGAGIGILYAALYAGHAWYDLLGMIPTFALMAGVTAVGVLEAVRRNSQFVAVLGLLGGYLTPVLLSTGDNKALALFIYIGLLLAGMLVAASRRGWWVLAGLAAPATAAVLLGWGVKFLGADQAPMAFAAATALGAMWFAAAWRRSAPTGVAIASLAGLAMVVLATLPYVPPRQLGVGIDSATISPLVMGHPWFAVLFLLLAAAGIQAIVTRRGWSLLAPAGPLVLVPGLLVFTIGWIRGLQPAPEWGDFGPMKQGLGGLYGLEGMPTGLLPALLLGVVVASWLAARLTRPPPEQEPTTRSKTPLLALHGVVAMLLASGGALLGACGMGIEATVLGIAVLGFVVLSWLVAATPGPRWAPLAALGVVTAALLVAMGVEQEGLLATAALAVVLFLAAPFVLVISPRTRSLVERPTPWLASALAGPLLFLPLHQGWEHSLGTDAIGLLPLALGAGTLTAAVVLRDRLQRAGGRTMAVYVAVALLFACLAVPVQLDNEWWTVGWALEGAALAWMSRRVRHPGVVGLSLLLLVTVTIRLVLNPEVLGYHPVHTASLLNWTLYGYGVPVLALLAASWWLRPMGEGDDPRLASPFGWLRLGTPAAVLMAVMVGFVLINLEVSAVFPEGDDLHLWSTTFEASMTRSISWAVFGLLLMLPAQRNDLRYLRPVALLFLLMAALKVFLLDLWQLSGIVRVGSLFGVAITLILAALAFQRLVLRDESKEEEE